MSQTRRLAAILAADVAGYSRLMGADEEGTHERLKAHLQELVEPKIAEHRGRTVKNTGDGFLAEFASVVDAVRCAVEIQRRMIDREPEVPEERRIRFRIGVNLGDVIVEPHDIFGDGVNVAARLEALAEPGGISISRMVRDQIRDKLPYQFEDLGEQSVKNIARPVRVYALRPEPNRKLQSSGLLFAVARRGSAASATIAVLVAGMVVVAASGWWFWPTTRPASTPAVAAATSIAQPLAAPRLSIVVLPFANLSNDPEQQYFADAITEDLTTDLSRIAGMFVISRNTAFTYQGKRVDTKQIGRELGVRYVLEGSVRRAGDKVRVNAQLINAEADAHLWADQFDGDTGDLFALQNEITSRLANSLGVELVNAEAARPTDNPDAVDYIFRGRAAFLRPVSRESEAEAINLFEHALTLDPQSVEARTLLAGSLAGRVMDAMTVSATADLARAEGLIDPVLAARPRDGLAHLVKGTLLRAQNRLEEALPEYEMALALNHNSTRALNGLAWCKLYAGSLDEAMGLWEQEIRLSPLDPNNVAGRYAHIGLVHLLQSRTDEAIAWLERARSVVPAINFIHSRLAAAYGLKGETERAAAELAEARKLVGDDRFSSLARLSAVAYWGVPKVRALYEATYFAGLRKAGMPEE
jgi:TolB-like protein/class 3 adenylate cyclase/tetratricopeptide (TPR) repeat protein